MRKIMRKISKQQLLKQYDKCLEYSNKLQNEIEKLSVLASKFAGEDIIADMCSGADEIEFRKMGDAWSTILIEELLENDEYCNKKI